MVINQIAQALKFAGRIIPAAKKLAKAVRKDSPGGKRITKAEMRGILRTLQPVLEDALEEVLGDDD